MTKHVALNPVVHLEMPARDLDRATQFYAAVFRVASEGWTID